MIKRTLFFTIILIFAFAGNTYAQCKDDSGVFKCATLLSDSVVYLNDFTISKKIKSNEDNGQIWQIYLIKGNKYRFALCCYQGLDNVIMKLYNIESPEANPINSTDQGGADKPTFNFTCEKSDVYYVSIRFKPGFTLGEKLCAIGLLGYAGKVK